MQLMSHKDPKNKTNRILQRESGCIVAFTFAVLLLASFLANTCVQILKNYGFIFIPSSYGKCKKMENFTNMFGKNNFYLFVNLLSKFFIYNKIVIACLILQTFFLETIKSSQFLWPASEPLPGNTVSTPVRYMGHYGSLVGLTVWRTGNPARVLSGWQPLQLATQIVPATLAVVPTSVVCYFLLLL